MMKKSNLLLFGRVQQGLFLLIVLFVFVSCVAEDAIPSTPNNSQTGEGNKVTFSINIPSTASVPLSRVGMNSVQKGITDQNENIIYDIHLLAFKSNADDNNQSVLKQVVSLGATDLTRDGEDESKYTFQLELPKGKYDFITLANLKNLKSNSGDTKFLRERLQDFVGEIKVDVIEQLVTNNLAQSWTYIPMSGMVNNVAVNGKSKDPILLSLTKALVRIDIEVADSASMGDSTAEDDYDDGDYDDGDFYKPLANNFSGFSIEEVIVYNYDSKGFLTPALNGDGSFDFEHVHIPSYFKTKELSSTFTRNNNLNEYFAPNSIKNLMYFNESDVEEANSDKVCLIIGALYDWEGYQSESELDGGTPSDGYLTYYRIDFERKKKDKNELESVPFLRNRNFKIKITKVNSFGYGTIREALEAGPNSDSNLSYELIEEDLSELGDIVFNGRNFLAVSPANLVIGKAEASEVFVITTDYEDNLKPNVRLESRSDSGSSFEEFKGSWVVQKNSSATLECDEVQLNGRKAFKYYVELDFNKNERSLDREVFLHVELGGLSIRVKITQTTKESLSIVIEEYYNRRWREVSSLSYNQEGYSSSPDKKRIRIRWTPASATINVVDLFEGLVGQSEKERVIEWSEEDGCSNPLLLNFNREGEMELFLQPKPIDVEIGQVASARQSLVFSLEEEDTGRTIATSLDVTQHMRALSIEAPAYVVMDGQTKTFTIKSNASYKLTIEKNGMDEELVKLLGSDKQVVTHVKGKPATLNFEYTGNRFDRENYETIIEFKPQADLDNPSIYSGELKLKISDTKSNAVFEKTIKCVSAVRQDGREANCYVLNPNYEVGILIPVKAAKLLIRDDNRYLSQVETESFTNQMLGEDEVFAAKLLWSDVKSDDAPGGLGAGGLVRILKPVGRGLNGYILVMPDKRSDFAYKVGNSLVAVTNSNGDKVFWSWHIWTLTDVEFEGDPMNSYIKPISTPLGDWLDRDLGAWTVRTEDPLLNYGYFYQWGRKDPTPPPANKDGLERALYDANGPVSISLSTSVWGGRAQNMSEALQNPLVFYMGNTLNRKWLDSNSNNLWYSSGKTIYDPCPAGYRVPAYSNNSAWLTPSNWQRWDPLKKGIVWSNSDPSVFFVASGYRGSYDFWGNPSAAVEKVELEGYRQTAFANSNDGTKARAIRFNSTVRPGSRSGMPDINRAIGLPVRCVSVH